MHASRTFFFYTLPHFSGGVLCFYVGRLCVCLWSVRPFVCTSFLFDNLFINRFHSNFAYAFCFKNVSLGIVYGQITIIYHRVMALVNGQKMVFGFQFLYYLEYHDETSLK